MARSDSTEATRARWETATAARWATKRDHLGAYLAAACSALSRQGWTVHRCQDLAGHPAATATLDDHKILMVGGDAPVALDLRVVSLRTVARHQGAFAPGGEGAWARIAHAEIAWPD